MEATTALTVNAADLTHDEALALAVARRNMNDARRGKTARELFANRLARHELADRYNELLAAAAARIAADKAAAHRASLPAVDMDAIAARRAARLAAR